MKSLTEKINETLKLNYLSSDDETNFELVAKELDNITSEISKWMEQDKENESSDTAALAHLLSNVAAQLRGDWKEEIVFNFY